MKPLILIGGGGHCKSAIDVIEAEGSFEVVGITDQKEKIGESINGYEIIAEDARLPELIKKYKNCLVTVGQLKDPSLKIKLYDMAKNAGAQFPVIISPHAYVSGRSTLGEGTIVFHRAVVNTNVDIGVNCIINTGSIIEHDSTVGSHTHIAPGAIVNGHCRVGNKVLIGSGAVMLQQTSVGDRAVIGANSTVNRSVDQPGIYSGSPIRRVGKSPS